MSTNSFSASYWQHCILGNFQVCILSSGLWRGCQQCADKIFQRLFAFGVDFLRSPGALLRRYNIDSLIKAWRANTGNKAAGPMSGSPIASGWNTRRTAAIPETSTSGRPAKAISATSRISRWKGRFGLGRARPVRICRRNPVCRDLLHYGAEYRRPWWSGKRNAASRIATDIAIPGRPSCEFPR